MPIELKDVDSTSDVEVSNKEDTEKKVSDKMDTEKKVNDKVDDTLSDSSGQDEEKEEAATSTEEKQATPPEPVSKETPKADASTASTAASTAAATATATTMSNNDDGRPPLPARKTTSVATDGEKEAENPKKDEGNPILKQLKEAFPGIEEKYIIMVIIASQGNVDSAFNALLYLSDPESSKDIELPSHPVHNDDRSSEAASKRQQLQYQQDEMLARKLNDEYNNRHGGRHRRYPRRHYEEYDNGNSRRRPSQGQYRGGSNDYSYDSDEDGWTQFVERDLPQMTAKANKSIHETASKVSNWFSNVTRNFLNEDDPTELPGEDAATSNPNGRTNRAFGTTPASRPATGNKFNSFGARVGEESLESHGISLNDNDLSDDEDIPPQLPSREKVNRDNSKSKTTTTTTTSTNPAVLAATVAMGGATSDPNASVITEDESQVIPQTTYIDTPDTETKKNWRPSGALESTPTKNKKSTDTGITKKSSKTLEDDLLIDSDDEL